MTEPLRIGTEWTIAHASVLHDRLLNALLEADKAGDTLALDLGDVESLDSSGIQLLLALRRSLQERGQELRISQASATARAALDVYRLRPLLMPPEAL